MYWAPVNGRSIWSQSGHWEPPTDFIVSNWNMQRLTEYISHHWAVCPGPRRQSRPSCQTVITIHHLISLAVQNNDSKTWRPIRLSPCLLKYFANQLLTCKLWGTCLVAEDKIRGNVIMILRAHCLPCRNRRSVWWSSTQPVGWIVNCETNLVFK